MRIYRINNKAKITHNSTTHIPLLLFLYIFSSYINTCSKSFKNKFGLYPTNLNSLYPVFFYLHKGNFLVSYFI